MAMLFRRAQLEALAGMMHDAYKTAPEDLIAGILHVQKILMVQPKADNPRFDESRFIAAIRRQSPMQAVQALAASAERVAGHRGHSLSSWTWNYASDTRITGSAVCRDCKREAFVDSKPAPNGIDISGEAIALNCTEGRNHARV